MGLGNLFLGAIAVSSLIAQTRPVFDAVSIKPSTSSGGQSVRPIGDRVVATDATLRELIQFAYRSSDGRSFLNSQIIGVPRWAETDRFNVQAKASAPGGAVPPRQLQIMTRAMLEDRFQLKAHRETRELPVYDLVPTKGAMKMKLAPDQTPTDRDADPVSLDPSGLPRGRFRLFAKPSPSGAITLTITGTAVTMAAFIGMLQQYLDRPVVNSTGVDGLYDVHLEFGLAQSQPAGSDEAPGVSLFTAIQEQLGLKLDAQKRSIEVLVVDHAEHPTPD